MWISLEPCQCSPTYRHADTFEQHRESQESSHVGVGETVFARLDGCCACGSQSGGEELDVLRLVQTNLLDVGSNIGCIASISKCFGVKLGECLSVGTDSCSSLDLVTRFIAIREAFYCEL